MSRHFTRKILLSLCLSLGVGAATSCHYHVGSSKKWEGYHSISIPYVEQDNQGLFTAELIRQISSQGRLQYQAEGGDLTLQIDMQGATSQALGFAYDYDVHGKRKKDIYPNESRLQQRVVVSIIEAETGRCLLGPCSLEASVEYDYQTSVERGPQLQATLGQIDQSLPATDYAQQPLYRKLAAKVACFIYHVT